MESGSTHAAMMCRWFLDKVNWGTGRISLQELGSDLKGDCSWALECNFLSIYDVMILVAKEMNRLADNGAAGFSWLNETRNRKQVEASTLRTETATDIQVSLFRTLVHLQGHIFMDEGKEALECARRYGTKELTKGCVGTTYHPHFQFYRGVAFTAFGTEGKEARRSLSEAKSILNLLSGWRERGNPNVLHMASLLEAEVARVSNRHDEAKQLYGDAIQFANRSGHIQDAGICNERAAAFYLQTNQRPRAAHHVQQAVKCYRDWGASAVAARVLETYGDLASMFTSVAVVSLPGLGLSGLTPN